MEYFWLFIKGFVYSIF